MNLYSFMIIGITNKKRGAISYLLLLFVEPSYNSPGRCVNAGEKK